MSDVESIPEANVEDDLEVILEGNEEPTATIEETQDDSEHADDEAEEANKKLVKPKRVVKNPKPKLNEDTLKSSRGLPALRGYFERVNFKGPGYEEQDLNVLMKTYEYWCHRLFPKFPFDSCIERLETLGTKRATLTQIKRIRMGLIDEEKAINSDDDVVHDSQVPTDGFVDTVDVDKFDELLSTQAVPDITTEQLEQMKKNKERAEKLRQERLQKIKQKSSQLLESSLTSTQNSLDISANSNSQLINETEEASFDQILGVINEGNETNMKEIGGMNKSGNKTWAGITSDHENIGQKRTEVNEVNFDQINNEHRTTGIDKRTRRILRSDSEDENTNIKTIQSQGRNIDEGTKFSARQSEKLSVLSDSDNEGTIVRHNQFQQENVNETEVSFDQILEIVNDKSKSEKIESNARCNTKKVATSGSDSEDEDNLIIDEDKESEVELSQNLDTNKKNNMQRKINSSRKKAKILTDSEDEDV